MGKKLTLEEQLDGVFFSKQELEGNVVTYSKLFHNIYFDLTLNKEDDSLILTVNESNKENSINVLESYVSFYESEINDLSSMRNRKFLASNIVSFFGCLGVTLLLDKFNIPMPYNNVASLLLISPILAASYNINGDMDKVYSRFKDRLPDIKSFKTTENQSEIQTFLTKYYDVKF